MTRKRRISAAVAAAVIALSACTAEDATAPTGGEPVVTAPTPAGADAGFADVVERIGPSVVTVQAGEGLGNR
ncbi:hypothetical protein [Saccharothrix deserti]|uniref:hypothetical protein n=1 Tax=Saccharothrix deserti TaxID=2593674 RepID=UPI00131CDE72|nr:hypothetical protein [Saccharothrix deserti]